MTKEKFINAETTSSPTKEKININGKVFTVEPLKPTGLTRYISKILTSKDPQIPIDPMKADVEDYGEYKGEEIARIIISNSHDTEKSILFKRDVESGRIDIIGEPIPKEHDSED